MRRSWRLTRTAEESLTEIARWTLETFGAQQAAAYEDKLIAVCNTVAAGGAFSQDCRHVIDAGLPEFLKVTRAGQHFIIFIEDESAVTILEFLHPRTDIAKRLREILDE